MLESKKRYVNATLGKEERHIVAFPFILSFKRSDGPQEGLYGYKFWYLGVSQERSFDKRISLNFALGYLLKIAHNFLTLRNAENVTPL